MSASAIELTPQQQVRILYERVLHVSNRVLYQCKTFHITILAVEDPSFTKIAHQMSQVSDMIKVLSDDTDPMVAGKAAEYCDLLGQIAVAIERLDPVALGALVNELERKSGL